MDLRFTQPLYNKPWRSGYGKMERSVMKPFERSKGLHLPRTTGFAFQKNISPIDHQERQLHEGTF